MKKGAILILEDEIIIAESLSQRLKNLGYTVTDICSTGVEALDSIEKNEPDLILVDIILQGDMDGIETVEKMTGEIPVIYLTAYVDRETLDRAKRTKPAAYLVKPFKEQDLKTNVEIALYKRRS